MTVAATPERRPSRTTTRIRRIGVACEPYADIAIACALALAVLLVHPLDKIADRPFWVDEAWVANLAKASLGQQVSLSSSTPIGWMLLVRLVPGHALQRYRVVPLAFSGVAAALAFCFARGLNWRNKLDARCAGIAAGAAVALAPISLQRNDLKQYTADGAFALLLIILGRRAEQDTGRRSLIVLSIAAVVVTPFSTVAVMVAAAVFAGLLASAALHRQWSRLRQVLAFGAASGAGILAYVVAFVLPTDNPNLRDYWRGFYLTGSPLHIVTTAFGRIGKLELNLFVPAPIVFALFVYGLVLLAFRRHIAVAVAAVVLWIEMFALGVAKRYPFLNVRTSHFLLVVSLVIAVIGFVGIARAAVRHKGHLLVIIMVAFVAFLGVAGPRQIGTFSIRYEDPRTQARFVAANRRADDVVVVSFSANWGFTYYWPGPERKRYIRSPLVASAFIARVDNINALFLDSRSSEGILEAMSAALEHWRSLGATGRIWVVRSHTSKKNHRRWDATFRALDLTPVTVTGGPEPLVYVDPNDQPVAR